MNKIFFLFLLFSLPSTVILAQETTALSPLYMDRGLPLGNSVDIDSRRALHIKIKNTALEPITVVSSGSAPVAGHTSVALVRNVYSSTNVTTAAYVQLIASTSDVINNLQIFDSSGQTLVLALGAAASEVDTLYIFPGGDGSVDLKIPAATRVSVRAISATANTGELDVSFLK